MKKKPNQHTYDDSFDFIEGTLTCLGDGNEEDCTTNQHVVGMRCLFCEFIVKTWKYINFSDVTCRKLNKIVMHYYVMHHKSVRTIVTNLIIAR